MLGANEFGPGAATLTALAPVDVWRCRRSVLPERARPHWRYPHPGFPPGPNIRIWGARPAANKLLGVTTAAITGAATPASWGPGLAEAVGSSPVCVACPSRTNTPAATTAVIMVVCLAIMIAEPFPQDRGLLVLSR